MHGGPPVTSKHGCDTPFGTLLRRHRLAAGLTQEELAERAGLSARGIGDLERGARSVPQRETVRLLIEALALAPPEAAAFAAGARHSREARSGQGATTPWPAFPRTPFIGREADVAAVVSLLQDGETPLVTLTGPGGVGKTRLAVEASGRLLPHFPGGVVFVDLAPLRDPALVIPAITEAVGLREGVSASVRERLLARLSGAATLLLVDNFEHVLPAAAVFAHVVAGSSPSRFLVTSRAPLRLRVEHEVSVAPLAADAAAALFVARATAARPLADTPEVQDAVREICDRLDCLPLAIELAAARTRLLSPLSLLARLERRLPALTAGARDLPARQQTLRDTIAWSHELLAPEERTLFHRLGVFAGGWTFEAAEAVGNHDGAVDVLSALGALVEHSLVRQDDAGPEPRFAMLETIREYALEQMGVEEPAVRAAHAAHVVAIAARIDPRCWPLTGPPASLVDAVARELDNARSALHWLLDTGNAESALCLAACLVHVWYTRDNPREGLSWLDRALVADADLAVDLRATALMTASALAHALGERRAVELARQSIALWNEAGDHPAGRAYAVAALALAHDNLEEFDLADRAYDDAIAAYEGVGDTSAVGIMLSNQAVVRYALGGDRLDAWHQATQALDLQLTGGHAWGLAIARNSVGCIAVESGDNDEALRQFAANLRAANAHGDKHFIVEAVYWIGVVAQRRGLPRHAARLLGAATAAEAMLGLWVMRRRTAHQMFGTALDHLAAQLGAADFERAHGDGRTLALEQAAREALALANEMLAWRTSEEG
jgi:predicted ATPase/DNA-binding XRE family transcriptional regulator